MTDVVGCQMHLNAILRQSTLLNGHDAGTVDDKINSRNIRPRKDFFGCVAHRFLTGEVDLQESVVYIWELGLEFIDALLCLRRTATGEDDMDWRLSGLETVSMGILIQEGELTKACAVVKPIPPRLTPVMRTFLPRIPSVNALATSAASVLAPKSGFVVDAMAMDENMSWDVGVII